jgi:hypothetical protein
MIDRSDKNGIGDTSRKAPDGSIGQFEAPLETTFLDSYSINIHAWLYAPVVLATASGSGQARCLLCRARLVPASCVSSLSMFS